MGRQIERNRGIKAFQGRRDVHDTAMGVFVGFMVDGKSAFVSLLIQHCPLSFVLEFHQFRIGAIVCVLLSNCNYLKQPFIVDLISF